MDRFVRMRSQVLVQAAAERSFDRRLAAYDCIREVFKRTCQCGAREPDGKFSHRRRTITAAEPGAKRGECEAIGPDLVQQSESGRRAEKAPQRFRFGASYLR